MGAALQLKLHGLVGPDRDDAPESRNDVEQIHIRGGSLLNWCNGPRTDHVYGLNPFRGCEMACRYCYARYTHGAPDPNDPQAFERRIFVKDDAPARLRRELRSKPVHRHGIVIGTVTDPYQPSERRFRVTRRILEELLPHRGISIEIATKSTLIKRDVALLAELAERNPLTVSMSIVSMDEDVVRALEPGAPSPLGRFDAMQALCRAGVPVALHIMPIIPGLTDHEANLEELVRRGACAGATSVASSVLRLNGAGREHFFAGLQKDHPELAARVEEAYAQGTYRRATYRRRLEWRIQALAVQHGFC